MPVYVAAGRTYKSYEAKGIITKSEYDDAGRLTRTTEEDIPGTHNFIFD